MAATADTAQAPQFTGARPVVQQDHLGASTFIEKGWSLISLGDYAGAIQALTKALALAPSETQAQSLLGWAQMLHEDYDDALATFSRVLMKEPANSLARINVGYICLKKRIFGEAIEHLSKAIRLDNDRKATLYAHYYLGLVYLEREMFEDAVTFFQKTLQLGPNLIEAYYELGRANWFMGDQAAAKTAWTEGFKANKFNPWGKRCKEMLDLTASGGEPPQRPPPDSRSWSPGRAPPQRRPGRAGHRRGPAGPARAWRWRWPSGPSARGSGPAWAAAPRPRSRSCWPRIPPRWPDSPADARRGGAPGVAFPWARTILLRADLPDLEQTLRHELGHLVLAVAGPGPAPALVRRGLRLLGLRRVGTAWRGWSSTSPSLPGGCRRFDQLDGMLRGSATAADLAYALAASAVAEIAGDRPRAG